MTTKNTLDAAARRRLLAHGLATAAAGLLAGCGGAADPEVVASDAGSGDRRRGLGGVDSGGTGSPMAMMFSLAVDTTSPLVAGGFQFDTDGATLVDADDRPLTAADLAPGMSSHIESAASVSASGITARAVRVSDQLLGPVSGLDPVSGRFTVLGQSVSIGTRTVFDALLPRGRAGLANGTVVRVWGELVPGRARVYATRIALAPAGESRVVRGLVQSIDGASGRIGIGGLVVGFDTADASLVAADLRVGDLVRARLDPSSTAEAATLLSLRDDRLRLADGVGAAIEGRITRVDSPTQFSVDGVTVDAASAGAWSGTHALVVGGRAEVKGHSAHGVLVASRLSVESPETVQLEGTISSADASRQSFVLRGVTVTWTASTRFEGGNARLLTARRKAAVIGRWSEDGTRLLADRIHVEA